MKRPTKKMFSLAILILDLNARSVKNGRGLYRPLNLGKTRYLNAFLFNLNMYSRSFSHYKIRDKFAI